MKLSGPAAGRELQVECCELLGGLVEAALGAPAGLQALGHLLPQLLAGLAETAELASASPEPYPNRNEVLGHERAGDPAAIARLLGRLTADAPAALRPFLRAAEPLPAGGPLAGPAAALAAGRAGVGLAEELGRLAGRAAGMPPSQLARSVAVLRRSLAARGAELLGASGPASAQNPGNPGSHPRPPGGAAELPDAAEPARLRGDGGGDAGGPGSRPPGVQAAAWQLVWLSREAGDGGLALLAGELLALVGPSDPFAIALPHAAGPRGGALAEAAPAEPGRKPRSGWPPKAAFAGGQGAFAAQQVCYAS